MIDEYYIISIDDRRSVYKDNTRRLVDMPENRTLQTIDGRDKQAVKQTFKHFGIHSWFPEAKVGELGLWATILLICEYAAKSGKTILTFEDDAIVRDASFAETCNSLVKECGPEMDVFAVMPPPNQIAHAFIEWENKDEGLGTRHMDIAPAYDVQKPRVCLAYQGYSFVSMVYTPKGAAKILHLARKHGIYMPIDCWAYEEHGAGYLNIYTPKPYVLPLVEIDNAPETTIHNSGRFNDNL